MLFNVLLLFLVLCSQIFMFLAYLNALNSVKEAFFEGYNAGKGGELRKIPRFSKKKPKNETKSRETEEDRKLNAILDNINAYDGTSYGQKEIK